MLKEIKGKSQLFQNSKGTKDHWLVAGGTGITYITYQLIITQNNAAVSLNFGRPSKQENKLLFDEVKKQQSEIEAQFGNKLLWDRSDEYKSSKVTYTLPNVNYFNKEEWTSIINFLIPNISSLENAFREPLKHAKVILNAVIPETPEEVEEILDDEIIDI